MRPKNAFRAAGLVALAAASSWGAQTPQQYIPCPQGLFRCGELSHPPASKDYKVPVICSQSDLNKYLSKIQPLKLKIGQGTVEMRQVASTLEALAGLYSDYAPKEAYLTETAAAIRTGLLGEVMEPAKQLLDHANECVHDPQWYHADIGCWIIGVDCWNPPRIYWTVQRLDPMIGELQDDLAHNKSMLRGGLPTYVSDGHGGNRCLTGGAPAPCRTHMSGAVDTLVNAIRHIRCTIALHPPAICAYL